MEQDQQFLEYVVKALVDNPADVKINRTVDEMGVLLTLSVNRDDMGKIIGRSGATAKAIRTVLRVVGMKNDARVNLKIEEPEGGRADGQGAPRGPGGMASNDNDMPEAPSEPYVRDTTVDDVISDLKSGQM